MRTFSFLQIRKVFATFFFFCTGKGEERKIIIRNEQWTSSSFAIFISRSNFFCSWQLPRGCDLRIVGTFPSHSLRQASISHIQCHISCYPWQGSLSNWNFKVESCGLVDIHTTHNNKTHRASSIVLSIALIFTSCCVSLFVYSQT